MPDRTVNQTRWTGLLMDDLYAALKNNRDDDTVRAFARELMDDKQLPISYLVRKVNEEVGSDHAERLHVLVRGRYVVNQEKAALHEASKAGVIDRLKGLFGPRD